MPSKILMVDDEPRVLAALKRALRKEPFEIWGAGSAYEALQLLSEQPMDVVVSDEKMPSMSGSELLAEIAVRYPETIRIMLTGHASLDVAVKAINEGRIYRFMTKPVSEVELAVTIRQALEYRKLLVQVVALKQTVARQSSVIGELESRYPGISELELDASGRIVLDCA